MTNKKRATANKRVGNGNNKDENKGRNKRRFFDYAADDSVISFAQRGRVFETGLWRRHV